jgi:DNA-binding PadR family transcriptional regulator
VPQARPLTELEGTALGVLWARQPCTPYQVRREFLDSPSPHWSGSAGAIYPLLERLERVGLVRSEAHATGARRSRRYRVTAAGRRALICWMGPPVGDDIVGVPPDPLRARIALLTLFPPAEQHAYLREVELGLGRMIGRSRAYESKIVADAYTRRMSQGAIAMQATRLGWIRALRRTLTREAAQATGKATASPQKRRRARS